MRMQELADNILKNAFERWKKEHPEQAHISFDDWRHDIKDIQVIRARDKPAIELLRKHHRADTHEH